MNAIERARRKRPKNFRSNRQASGSEVTNKGAGRATIEFEASERYANPMGTLLAECSAIWQMRDGRCLSQHPRARRDGHHHRIENQLSTASLERKASS